MTGESTDQILDETKRAARDLAVASAKLSKHLLEKASIAARDPSGTAHKAADRVAKELDAVAKHIDEVLKDL